MPSDYHDIEERAKGLSPEERARLAECLLESLRGQGIAEIEAAWEHEIGERVAAYRRGEEEVVDGETVLAELRQIAG